MHERLIDLAEDLLGTDQLRLYQGHATAKYSDGGDPEYEQLLHVDYGNHTLVVPRTDVGYRHLELFVYLSDVTPETAATRMVSRRLTGDIPVERTYLSLDEYASLYDAEVPASGPAGSVLAYRPDVYHRGTALKAKRAARFLLHVAYKPADTDWLGSTTWPSAAEGLTWHRFVPRPPSDSSPSSASPSPATRTGPTRRWPGWPPAIRSWTWRRGAGPGPPQPLAEGLLTR